MKMNKFQIDKGKTLDMEITDCVDYRKDEAIEHNVDSDSDSDSDESDSSVSSSDSSNSSSSEEDKKRKAF